MINAIKFTNIKLIKQKLYAIRYTEHNLPVRTYDAMTCWAKQSSTLVLYDFAFMNFLHRSGTVLNV